MAKYTGLVRFISSSKQTALVKQQEQGADYLDGYRRIKADFSSTTRDSIISYDYKKDLKVAYETENEVVIS
jgi:hypothetical protein